MEKDPVCGMDVDPATAEHEGKTYYFCSRMCKQAFEDNLQQYLKAQQPAS
jgi:P-type Cu+ transporter